MPDIVFPNNSAPGRRPLEGQGRLINCLTEPFLEGGQTRYAKRPAPGLDLFSATGGTGPVRGFIKVGNALLVSRGTRLIKVERTGGSLTVTDLGALPGVGLVTFAANNKQPTPDIVCTTSIGAYVCSLTVAPVSYPDPDLPQPNSVSFLDGYFIFTCADGRAFVSGLNSTTVNPLDYTTAQPRPGGLVRGITWGQQLFLFGPSFMEVMANSANATGFPFSRIAVKPIGLLAASAIAGFEDGWASALIWVGDNRSIYRLDGGYDPRQISTPDIDRDLKTATDPSTLNSLVFEHPGHSCWAVIGTNFAWVYDLSTGFWHERQSHLQPTWLARCAVRFFDDWIVGHPTDGNLYRVEDNSRREGGNPLPIRIRSGQGTAFPNRIAVIRADFNVVVGQGIGNGIQPIETDPVCWISYSDDGGNLFSTPVLRKLGRQGEYETRVTLNRCGLTSAVGRVWELEVSDPVYFTLMSATQELDVRPR